MTKQKILQQEIENQQDQQIQKVQQVLKVQEAEASERPLVSVVVPVYNTAQYLRPCVESICAQTYRNLELILVDDGSTDDSGRLCDVLSEGDARIRVIHQANGGLSAARNAGVQAAHGELVGFVDSDDLIFPDMYENLVSGYQEYAAAHPDAKPFFAQIGRKEVDENGNALPDALEPVKQPTFVPAAEYMESLLLYTGDVSFCTRLAERGLYLAHPFEKGILAEDFYLQVYLTPETEGVLRLPQPGYKVVHRKGSLTRRRADQFSPVYIAIVQHADLVEQYLVPRYPQMEQAAVRFGLYERLDYLLHVPIRDMNADNEFYMQTVHYLRSHFRAMRRSPYLNGKNKLYLTLLTAAPRLTRQIHWKLRGKKIMAQQ